MIKSLLALFIIFLLATFPATWLLMLFLGNLGLGLSYWGTLPLGILVSVLLGGATAPRSSCDHDVSRRPTGLAQPATEHFNTHRQHNTHRITQKGVQHARSRFRNR